MEITDIRERIMSDIVDDVKHLKNVCSVDKKARMICFKRSYWQNIFNQNDLVMPKFYYTTPEEWLLEFEKEAVLKMDTQTILQVLNNPSVDDFYGNDNFDNDLGSLFVSSDELPFNLII